jgi:hypothetical protein
MVMIVGNIKDVKITATFQFTLSWEVSRALKAKVADLLVFVQQTDASYGIQGAPPRLTDALRVAGRIKL